MLYGEAMRDDEAVVDAAHRRAVALASGDGAALADLLHPEFRWTSHRGQTFDRSAYLDSNVSGGLVWRAQTLSDVSVTVAGDTAVLTCRVTDEVERDGRAERFSMPMTQVWVRSMSGWLCLAGHAGPLLP